MSEKSEGSVRSVPGESAGPAYPADPDDPAWQRRLRSAVVEQALLPGRHQPPVLRVGEPAGPQWRVDVAAVGPTDAGLRTDLAAALLQTAAGYDLDRPLVWLTRSGDLALQDVDVAWLAAAAAAAAEAGRTVATVVVTARGWRDPRSGRGRTWVRLRLPRA